MTWRPDHELPLQDYLAIMDAWLTGNAHALRYYGAESSTAEHIVAVCLAGWSVAGKPLCVDHLTHLVGELEIDGGGDAVEVAWQALQSEAWWDEFVDGRR